MRHHRAKTRSRQRPTSQRRVGKASGPRPPGKEPRRAALREEPQAPRCSSQAAATEPSISASLSPFGCRPSRIASTMSGARHVRGRSRARSAAPGSDLLDEAAAASVDGGARRGTRPRVCAICATGRSICSASFVRSATPGRPVPAQRQRRRHAGHARRAQRGGHVDEDV
jgi:hypothetical protein